VPTLSNDTTTLTPRTAITARTLELDFPALHIGVAEYDEGPTGCTVFHFPDGANLAVDVRGGSPGVVGDYGWSHAVCFAGGSIYGLEVVSGVAAELLAQRDYSPQWDKLALVSGAIVYDFTRRDTSIYPDKPLGRAALRAAQPGRFPLGPHGAGRMVTVGRGLAGDRGEPGGQGGAFRQIGNTKVAVFTVVNAVGAIVDRAGQVVRGNLNPATGEREPIALELEQRLSQGASSAVPGGNTTVSLVVTNRKLDTRSLEQLGKQVHASMARAIQPFHCLYDGDVLFTASTNEVEDDSLDFAALGVLASELAWDAVLTCYQE
jgi:L-aminopeptidase/D-esterase-like protein